MFRLSRFRRYIKHSRLFDQISKHLEVSQKYSATRRNFNSLLGVWKCGQTWFFFYILSQNQFIFKTKENFRKDILTILLENSLPDEGNGLHEDSFWKRDNNLVPRVSRDPGNEVGEAIGKLESGLFACAFIDSSNFLNMSLNVFMLYIFRHDPSPCHAFALLFNWPVTFSPVKTAKKTS